MNANSRLEQLRKLLEREPDDAFLNFGIAMELAKLGDRPASLTHFARVLELDPNYLAAYYHGAKTRLADGDMDGARAVLQEGMARSAANGEQHSHEEMAALLASIA